MRIGIDFDETLTKDPVLWSEFIQMSGSRGHDVVCVTARRLTEENAEFLNEWMSENGIDIPIYFTRLSSKVEYMKKLGMDVDIWIDDDPRSCALGH